ncbi:transcriptional regulator [Salmonella enterica subsp. enterica]|nr:transcriptional regulator [Salmonella enterica subsp. enterica]SUH20762.1 transcriptional regulator [Salmonella enterica subsp. enterica]
MESKLIDWHPADIIAGLRKKGTSMAAESRRNGLSSSTLANALTRPWPKGELIIAKALGTEPWLFGHRVITIRARMSLSTERGL